MYEYPDFALVITKYSGSLDSDFISHLDIVFCDLTITYFVYYENELF